MQKEPYELPLTELTLPELLDRSSWGYDHSAVGKWHLSTYKSPSAGRHPQLSGFNWYAGSLGNLLGSTVDRSEDGAAFTPPKKTGYYYWMKDTNGEYASTTKYATTDTVDDAIARIRAMRSPWFLWVAFNAAHSPYHEPPPALHTRPSLETNIEKFDAMVEALDTEIGRLLASIDPEILAATTIIFVSDNGSPAKQTKSPGQPRHFKGTLYEGGINVPLIVAGPLVTEPGSESAALVHVVDVFPTLAEIAGVNLKDLRGANGLPIRTDGISLLPYLRDSAAPSQRDVVFQDRFRRNGVGPYRVDQRMVRNERYKLVETAEGASEFYDLAGRVDDGPNLIDSLSQEQRAAYEGLHRALDEIVAELDAERKGPEIPAARGTP